MNTILFRHFNRNPTVVVKTLRLLKTGSGYTAVQRCKTTLEQPCPFIISADFKSPTHVRSVVKRLQELGHDVEVLSDEDAAVFHMMES